MLTDSNSLAACLLLAILVWWRPHKDAILCCQPHIQVPKDFVQLGLVTAAEHHHCCVRVAAQSGNAVVHCRIHPCHGLQEQNCSRGAAVMLCRSLLNTTTAVWGHHHCAAAPEMSTSYGLVVYSMSGAPSCAWDLHLI